MLLFVLLIFPVLLLFGASDRAFVLAQGPNGARLYLPLIVQQTVSLERIWDPRLDQRGTVLIPAQVLPGQGYWRLVKGIWYDEQESAGRHHILMDTLDSNGQRRPGVLIRISSPDDQALWATVKTEAKPGEPYAAAFLMQVVAPAYRAQPRDGAPADAVSGMGLGSIAFPGSEIYTSYGFTWRWVVAPSATPTPTVTLSPSATPSPTETPAPTETPSPTATATVLPTATATQSPTPSPTASATASPTPTTTLTSSGTVTPTFTPTPTATGWPRIALTPLVSGMSQPVHITHAGDGSGRIFVVEQGGRIRIIRNGVLAATPFLDIAGRVSCCGERGLLSVAFPPGYAAKGHFYVNYTNKAGNTVVARYRLTANPDVADVNSEQILLTVSQPYPNHNGGQLAFGPNDGFLYIGMGDGGSAGDPDNRAQNPADLLGKLLRIDVESGSSPYAIPATNPFIHTAGYRGEIWALGLRNPWRFAFDRLNGDLYIADVGQDKYEEVNHQPGTSGGGQNYGWRVMEGLHCYNPANCNPSGFVLPVVEYSHAEGCSITGGFVYRGTQFGRMQGTYFYADYCNGKIWGLRRVAASWTERLLLDAPFRIATFGEDESGEVYVADYNGGVIYRIIDQA